MKVSQLIDRLRELDPDEEIFVRDSDGDLADVEGVSIQKISVYTSLTPGYRDCVDHFVPVIES